MYLTAPDIPTIRTSFSIKPSSYTVSAMPTSEEVTALRKAITSNLKKLPCILPGTSKTGWSWILLNETEFRAANEPEDADPDDSLSIPDYPKVRNPGLFSFTDKQTDKVVSQLREGYVQQLYVYQYCCNIEQAILLDLKEAIPTELIANLQDDDGDLNATVKTILDHMEKYYNTLKP